MHVAQHVRNKVSRRVLGENAFQARAETYQLPLYLALLTLYVVKRPLRTRNPGFQLRRDASDAASTWPQTINHFTPNVRCSCWHNIHEHACNARANINALLFWMPTLRHAARSIHCKYESTTPKHNESVVPASVYLLLSRFRVMQSMRVTLDERALHCIHIRH